MKTILMFLLLQLSLFADKNLKFMPSIECKECHTQIYNEFYGSMHAKSTPSKDPIHKAIWDIHPKNKKFNQYTCGKCHTPTADNLDDMLKKGKKAMPDINNKTHQEAISCAYCHRIEEVKEHKDSNINIINETPKNYYGNLNNHLESPYHKIIKQKNEHMKNGNICMGCHSHKTNKHSLVLCTTESKNDMDDEANCISCHMPKVKGSISNINDTKTHSFHGFPGTHFHSDMLTQYVDISILKNKNDFIIYIDNKTSHALLLHPLRVGILKISVKRANQIIKLKNEMFVRVLGKNGKSTMPWLANSVVKDTMIKANEKREVKRDFILQKGDRVDVVLGWFLVNPKALKKLGLEKTKEAKEFHIFKKQSFKF
ncbi:MAG: cytochrome c family protein [Sulfurimonas sp.]|nr:cytochrome c family protein [Sulfurimonas sp.]